MATGRDAMGTKRPYTNTGEPPSLEDVKYHIEKRLFVGRLPMTTSEDEIREVFGAHGVLTECRVLLEKGVAFVGYNSWASAHRALLATDGQLCLRGCGSTPLAVYFAERTGTGRGAGAVFAKGLEYSRVFVGNLPEHFGDAELRQIFESYGTVEAANLLPAKSNRRCGFVNFALWGEALDAIESLDGQRFPGQIGDPLSVVLASPRETGATIDVAKRRRLGVEPPGMPTTTTATVQGMNTGNEEIEQLKAAYLQAVDSDLPAEVCNDLHNKIMASRALKLAVARAAAAVAPVQTEPMQSFGYQDSLGVAGAGVGGLAGSGGLTDGLGGLGGDVGSQVANILGGSSSVLPVNFPAEDRDAARLFVGGLPYECTAEELRALIEQVTFSLPPDQCQLRECRVLPNKGCGYIRFSSWEAATEAIASLNDRAVSGWQLPLRVRWATPKASTGHDNSAHQSAQATDAALATSSSALSMTQDPSLAAVSGALQALLGGDAGSLVSKLGNGLGTAGGTTTDSKGGATDEAAVRAQGLDPRRLFVGQLTRDLRDKAELTRLFEPFGQIESLRWLEDKCVAYVQYADFSSARAAVSYLDGKHFPGISREMGINCNFSKLR